MKTIPLYTLIRVTAICFALAPTAIQREQRKSHMNVHRIFDPRKLGLAAAAAMMAGLATTGVAAASPPAAPSASVANLTLTITGTRADDLVAVSTDAATGEIQVDFGIDGSVEQTFGRNEFTAITALLDDGDDTFIVVGGHVRRRVHDRRRWRR